MLFNTIRLEITEFVASITIDRIENNNTINQEFLNEMNHALDEIERSLTCRIIIIQGKDGFFCTGMDFIEATRKMGGSFANLAESFLSSQYMETIRRLTLIPRIVISKVDGQVMAGGMGIAAASDLVVATRRSQFSLSEALWGLLPGCVAPYLIRRIGFQNAYKMTLTTMSINAQKAYEMNLVDELTEAPENVIRQMMVRLIKLEAASIKNVKDYFRKMWFITDAMEKTAIDESSRLAMLPEVQKNIQAYVLNQRFPWEKHNSG